MLSLNGYFEYNTSCDGVLDKNMVGILLGVCVLVLALGAGGK